MQGWGENTAGNQSLLLVGMACQMAGNNPRHGPVAVIHQHLFAITNQLNMGTELSFQIADIDASHAAIISDVTMLVISKSRTLLTVPWSDLAELSVEVWAVARSSASSPLDLRYSNIPYDRQ